MKLETSAKTSAKTSAAALAFAITAGLGLFAMPTAAAGSLVNCDVDPASIALRGIEPEVFNAINKMRAHAGLAAVTHTDTLSRSAEWASVDSAKRGFSPSNHVDSLGRNIPTRFAQCGVPSASRIAEINYYGTYATPADAMKFWANSSGHRAIILDSRLKKVGVAVIYQGNLRHWTVTFSS
ncbi:CAP domain-containing protein [Nocardia uniformis]|uniref:CAP domain-containing protein n=1 Tax=Nocardia uniformis TaxID=53432 RepID=A0A849CHW8_9NOCA|nr:CAP domain-containing protein [Nocardia uniformis]NNH75699.1 CAP domain-containing protein [Nocardia uniformis]